MDPVVCRGWWPTPWFESAGESVAAEVVTRVPRAFVARRPFPHASALRVCFTTTVVTPTIPVPVVTSRIIAAGIIASDIVPSGSHAAVVPKVVPTVTSARRTAVVEAVLAHAAIVAGIAPVTAGLLAAAGVALDVPATGMSCGTLVDTTAIGTTLIGGAACTTLVCTPLVGTARGGAAGGGALLHHPLFRAGIPAADRTFRLLRPLLGRPRRTTALRGRGGGRFLFAAGFLGGSGSLGGPASPLFGGLDDFGGGSS